ncbi:MAG: thioesterase family protein [Stagnimonas sp.]|nr:thioesterase family protein [Stagnimonas sp.]
MSAEVAPTLAGYAHRIQLAVRWGDMDALGHINNVKFFTYDEQVRLQYFDTIAAVVPDFWKGSGIILAKLGCDFVGQLRYPATLDIGFRISRLGRSSLDTEAAMFEGERLIAVSRGTLVWFDYTRQKSLPIPETVRALIRGREVIAPLES